MPGAAVGHGARGEERGIGGERGEEARHRLGLGGRGVDGGDDDDLAARSRAGRGEGQRKPAAPSASSASEASRSIPGRTWPSRAIIVGRRVTTSTRSLSAARRVSACAMASGSSRPFSQGHASSALGPPIRLPAPAASTTVVTRLKR